MSAEIQVELIKKVARKWALSSDCSGVDAMIAIMEILDFNPYPDDDEAAAKDENYQEQAGAVAGGD